MTKVKRLIGIRRRVLDHIERRILTSGPSPESLLISHLTELIHIEGRSKREIEKSLDHIIALDHPREVGCQVVTNGITQLLGLHMSLLEKRKNDKGKVPLLILPSGIKPYLFR